MIDCNIISLTQASHITHINDQTTPCTHRHVPCAGRTADCWLYLSLLERSRSLWVLSRTSLKKSSLFFSASCVTSNTCSMSSM